MVTTAKKGKIGRGSGESGGGGYAWRLRDAATDRPGRGMTPIGGGSSASGGSNT